MASQPYDDRRASLRIAADTPAILRGGVGETHGRLVDVSAGGAMVAVEGPVPRGAEVTLEARGLEVVATVAWETPGQCGLSFHRRLHLGEVALLTRKGRRALVANG